MPAASVDDADFVYGDDLILVDGVPEVKGTLIKFFCGANRRSEVAGGGTGQKCCLTATHSQRQTVQLAPVVPRPPLQLQGAVGAAAEKVCCTPPSSPPYI